MKEKRQRLEPRLIKERDKLICNLYHRQKFTMVELGQIFRMSTQQIYYIVKLDKIKKDFLTE